MKRLSIIVCLFIFALMPLMAQVKQTVAVLGDSYSTFEGFIPKGYATWYTTAVQKATDVNKVEQTWWWQVIKEGGYKMGNINSYSGSTICNTGYRDEDYSDRSFINRTTLLGNPDIILICGGTNDSWANVPIGNYQYSNWKRADLYCFRPALAKLLSDLRQRHPNVDIYFILNSELKDEINESVKKICKTYQVPVIALHDIDKPCRPGSEGDKEIKFPPKRPKSPDAKRTRALYDTFLPILHTNPYKCILVAISTLTMLVDVETFLLYSLVNTYTYTLIYYLEDNIGNYDAVDDAYHGGYHLNPKLMPVAIEGTLHAFGSCYVSCGEYTGEDRSQNTTHTMNTKGIEGIIILELLLHHCYHEEADDGGNDSDAEST